MATFKQEFIDLAYDFANTDEDFSTIAQNFTITQASNAVYDTVTGEDYEFTTDTTVKVIPLTLNKTRFNPEDVESGDRFIMVPKKNLTITLNLNDDKFYDAAGNEYRVIDSAEDPADAAYILQLRLRKNA